MNILLIEDDPILNETIADFLKLNGNSVVSLTDGGKAIDVINDAEFNLYIIDINIPHINGLEIVKHIRQTDLQTPIIMMTASIELESLKSAYKNGCDDYIKKPFYLDELDLRIEKLIKNTLEIELVEQQNIKLKKHANYDALTQIRNRRCLSEFLDIEIKRSKRYQHPFSLIFMDIDHFKRINDSYGHSIGDKVLINISNITSDLLRNIDIFGRWGGEEFLIILPETTLSAATYTAERIRSTIEQHPFENIDSVTLSLGVIESQLNETIDSLIVRADQLLYKAKSNGRNCVVSV